MHIYTTKTVTRIYNGVEVIDKVIHRTEKAMYSLLEPLPMYGPIQSATIPVLDRSSIDAGEYIDMLNKWSNSLSVASKAIEQAQYRHDLGAALLDMEKRDFPFHYRRPLENSLIPNPPSSGETTIVAPQYTPLTPVPHNFVVKYWQEIKGNLDHAKMAKARDAKASKQRILASAAAALRKGTRGKVRLIPAKYLSSKRSMSEG